MRILLALVLSVLFFTGSAQKKTAFVSGVVVDENELPLAKVSIVILGKQTGLITDDSGHFRIKVPAGKTIALVFTYTGYAEAQKNFFLSEDEEEKITLRMDRSGKTMQTVVVSDEHERNEPGLTKINPKNALVLPTMVGGVEGLIKVLVGGNNELTSQYSVRGGNYDENLIYINDFEIFRPYLIRSGQQEGLSLINPELARNISFYNGGFQSKYGDKMSSILDIQYKKPKSFAGSAYISLLEQGVHLEGAAGKGKFTYLVGARNRNNSNPLSSQEVKGAYIPRSTDLQVFLGYELNKTVQLELLTNFSNTKFTLIPESASQTTSVFSPLFSANLGLDILYEGMERSAYKTNMTGLTVIHQAARNLKFKWMLSRFQNKENESFDIGGTYLFGDRDFDKNSPSFGQIINPLGAGYYQNYGRNELTVKVWNASLKGALDKGRHYIQFGGSFELTNIDDQLYEWEYEDSAGYSLPVNTGQVKTFLQSTASLSIQKYSGYVQDNIHLRSGGSDVNLQAGLRYNYNSLNGEFFASPRVQVSIKPAWKKDVILKFAAGSYNQPPFYRELRQYDGSLNTAVKSQKSYQFVAGMDYNFINKLQPFRVTAEAYYKILRDVNPYDIDNLRIRYFGNNDARAYAYGLETRLYTELVKDAESWLSFGLMHTMEDIEEDQYMQYLNAAGEIITRESIDKTPVDSIPVDVGWVRRPTDRLVTAGLFLQDYLSTNKNFRVYLNLLYGSNMPYNIPNSTRYRNALKIDPYIRVDIGFGALLLGEQSKRRSHHPFKGLKSIWASFEVFNLLDRSNTISYHLVKDFSNTTYSIPNRLTPRLLNFKILTRF